MRIVVLLLFSMCLAAEDAKWSVHVVRVVDGDTLFVADSSHRVTEVRLLYVDTDESHDNRHGQMTPEGIEAAEFVKKTVPVNTPVELVFPSGKMDFDKFGRLLAIVCFNTSDGNTTLQHMLILSGRSTYWRKYGPAPGEWDGKFIWCQDYAMHNQAGGWKSEPLKMLSKAQE